MRASPITTPTKALLALTLSVWLAVSPLLGADNQASGDVAGDAGALEDSNVVTLASTGTQLALVKRAYLDDGTRVADLASLPVGSVFNFLVYISNDSAVAINDVSVRDVLDPAFVYQSPSTRVDDTVADCAAPVCNGAEEDNIFSVVEVKAPSTDGIDGDVVSLVGATIHAGDALQPNARLDIPANSVWAMAYRVSIPSAMASTLNQATGGIGAVNNGTLLGGDGSGDAGLSLSGVALTLVKQARNLAGAVLANNGDVALGQEIYFVLYVDNPTSGAADDIRITDLLDESQFTYVPSSLEQAAVPSGSNDAAIWAGTWTGLTDDFSGPDDEGSAGDSGGPASADRITIGAVSGQANLAVAAPATTLRAFRFRVTVN